MSAAAGPPPLDPAVAGDVLAGAAEPGSARAAALGRIRLGWLRFSASPAAMIGLGIIAVLVLSGIFAPWIVPQDPYAQSLPDQLRPPSAQHWFGTDEFGRDIFSRVVQGTRVTLLIVLLVAALAAPIGLAIGCAAGYLGGRVDAVLMRLTDIALAFPRLVLALAFVAALGPGLDHAILAIALTGWPPYARLARAEALTLRRSDYIAAVRLLGASPARIILRHVLPLCLPSLLVRATLDMAGVILIAAGLGFLGLGAQPPTAEWGAMLSAGREYLLTAWWVATIPGLAIFFTSMGFNLLGDGLRDLLDPRQAG
ncbi:nickel transporter permease [Roseomonas sp. BN140053]|uniref:nickel transporter permease n=1 Tax=Roseomonas sp. BN140053 TaxID=3391898 RepID=UPI0039E9C8B7